MTRGCVYEYEVPTRGSSKYLMHVCEVIVEPHKRMIISKATAGGPRGLLL